MGLYRTLSLESKGKYKEKGSKFEAYAYPVEDLEQVQEYLTKPDIITAMPIY